MSVDVEYRTSKLVTDLLDGLQAPEAKEALRGVMRESHLVTGEALAAGALGLAAGAVGLVAAEHHGQVRAAKARSRKA